MHPRNAMRKLFFTLAAALLMTAAAHLQSPTCAAQSALTANTLQLDDPAQRPAATIEDVAWLAGHWRGEGLGGEIEEVWTPPMGNTMACAFKLTKADTVSFYELAVLVEEENSVAMWVKHFQPDFTGWEEKGDKVEFPLVRIAPDALYFEGLTFIRQDEDTLDVYLAIGSKGGEVREVPLSYRRYR